MLLSKLAHDHTIYCTRIGSYMTWIANDLTLGVIFHAGLHYFLLLYVLFLAHVVCVLVFTLYVVHEYGVFSFAADECCTCRVFWFAVGICCTNTRVVCTGLR